MLNILPLLLVTLGLRSPMAYASTKSIYNFKVLDVDGKEISLEQFAGKVIMIVNVASKCGFTPQYEGLEKIYKKYKDQGFVILGFPANNFGGQEPGTESEIKEFCTLNYNVDFPLFKKASVRGDDIQPVFKFLTEEANSAFSGSVLWNFEKFLINKKGQLVERYRSMTKPDSDKVIAEIEKLIKEK